jgi:hypothetical protein
MRKEAVLQRSLLLGLLFASLLLVGGCTAGASPAKATATSAATAPGTVKAPNGAVLTRYAFAGADKTMVGGQPVNWKGLPQANGALPALLGDVVLGDQGWTITGATLVSSGNTYQAQSSATVLVQGMELADGTSCWFAGRGATFGFQDQRANFTCGDRTAKEITALFGELKAGTNGYEILRATGSMGENGFQASKSDTVGVAALFIGQ